MRQRRHEASRRETEETGELETEVRGDMRQATMLHQHMHMAADAGCRIWWRRSMQHVVEQEHITST